MSNIKLKPCPLCGGETVFGTSFFRNGAYEVHAECCECGAMGPRELINDYKDPERPAQDPTACAAEAALNGWNKMAGEDDE